MTQEEYLRSLLDRFLASQTPEMRASVVTITPPTSIDATLTDWVLASTGTPFEKDGRIVREDRYTREVASPAQWGGWTPQPSDLEKVEVVDLGPAPVPVPDPDPEPVPTDRPEIKIKALNKSAMLCFRNYYGLARYSRGQTQTIIKATDSTDSKVIARDKASQKLKFGIVSQAGGGVAVPFPVAEYQLLVDGEVKLTQAVTVGAKEATFDLGPIINDISEGWHEFDIRPETGCTSVPMPVYVSRHDGPHQEETTRVITGTQSLVGDHPFSIVKTTAAFDPPDYSLPPFVAEPFSEPLSRGQLFREMLVPIRGGHIYRPNQTEEGIPTTGNWQAYHWAHFLHERPTLHPLLDGPRGVGNLFFVTHLMPGRFGDCYFADPHRIGIVFRNGTVKTLSGLVDEKIPPLWHEAKDRKLTLRGIWETDRKGYAETWSIFWLHSSIQVDENAPKILNDRTGEMESPHTTGPVLFACDSKNNRLLRHIFPRDHHGEPVVQEFITGLGDPWGGFEKNGIIYIAERTKNRVSKWDANTGAYLGNLIECLPSQTSWAYLSSGDRVARRNVSLEQARTAPILMPEGMDFCDDWAYIASTAQLQIIRVNMVTGERQICFTGMEGNYIQIAVAKDDSFGPKHAIYASNWGAGNFGMPSVRLPLLDEATGQTHTGTWKYNAWTGDGNIVRGKGGNWGGCDYTSAVGIGQGMLYCGFSNEGLAIVRKAQPSDPTVNTTKYRAGANYYRDKGYILAYGPAGYGYNRTPLPWGENADLDYYLEMVGHTKP